VAQPVRVHQHLVLLFVAALGIDFRHLGNGAQQGAQYPVLDNAALGQLFLGEGPVAVIGPFQGVLVNLPQAGGDGAQHRGDPLGHAGTHLQQPFHD